MKHNAESLIYPYYTASFLALVIFLYYNFGGSSFPDYAVYKKISEGIISQSYITEFFSGYMLQGQGVELLGLSKVDSFIVVVQVLVFVLIIYLGVVYNEYSYSVFIFSCLYGALLLTTTVRAAPLYVLFLFWCIIFSQRGISLIQIFLFSMIGMLFHDSFILCTLSLLIYKTLFFFSRLKIFDIGIKFFFYILPLVFIFGGHIKSFIVELSGFEFLGARKAYLEADLASTSKLIYCLAIYFLSLASVKQSLKENIHKFDVNYLVFSFNFVFCLLFLLNNVAAIRFSIFIITLILIIKRCFIFNFERSLKNGVLLIPIYLCLGLFQFYILI